MGEIGDYIHYHVWNYQKHGITKDGSKQQWSTIHNELLNTYIQNNPMELPKEQINEIEGLLTSIMHPTSENQSYINSIRKEIEKKLIEEIEKELLSINWSTMGIDKSSKIGVGNVSKTNLNDIFALEDKINQVESLWNQFGKSGKTEADFIKQKNATLAAYAKLKAKILGAEDDTGWSSLSSKYLKQDKSLKTDIHYKGGKRSESLQAAASAARAQLVTLIREFAAIPAYNLAQGNLLQYAIAFLPEMARNEAITNVNKIFKRVIGGTAGREVVTINTNEYFQKKFVTQDFYNGSFIKTSTAQGKVDVQLQWKENPNLLKISAKNISVNSDSSFIHLVSDSSLLYLIQDLNSDFVNHFLNIFAIHGEEYKRQQISNYIITQRQNMKNEMIMVLFLKALTGANYGRKSANIFLVNDITGKNGIKLVIMSNLIKDIYNSNNISLINVTEDSSKDFLSKGFDNAWFGPLEWGSTYAQQRITTLLLDVHSRKISVKLKPSAVYGTLK